MPTPASYRRLAITSSSCALGIASHGESAATHARASETSSTGSSLQSPPSNVRFCAVLGALSAATRQIAAVRAAAMNGPNTVKGAVDFRRLDRRTRASCDAYERGKNFLNDIEAEKLLEVAKCG
jgi:hypothetical protein